MNQEQNQILKRYVQGLFDEAQQVEDQEARETKLTDIFTYLELIRAKVTFGPDHMISSIEVQLN